MIVNGDINPEEFRTLAASTRSALGPSIEAMQQAIERSIAPMLEAQRRALDRSVAPLVQAQSEAINAWVQSNRATVLEPLLRAGEKFREAWVEAIPLNLRELEADSFFGALKITIDQGPCVVWVPRAEIVEALVAGETFDDRSRILVERREEVLSDVTAALAEATCEILDQQADARWLASQAVEAARDGHDAAAQALVAAGLACVLQEVLHYGHLGAAYKDMAGHDIEETTFDVLRLVAIESATSRALVNTDEATAGFNRHGTLHGQVAFYGTGEMLAGLLLLVAWVRELSWLAEHEPTFLLDVA